jgi:hypothetical protein
MLHRADACTRKAMGRMVPCVLWVAKEARAILPQKLINGIITYGVWKSDLGGLVGTGFDVDC